MAKGLNQVQVGLTFTADTGQAKAQLQDLKNTINSLYGSTAQKSPIEGLTPKVNNALNAVVKLKTALESATNVDTGRLDLSKFSQQLQQSNISLKQYAHHLTQLGPTGEKAFMQLAQSIVTAEVPMRKANAALTEMWTTLKNTARWQLSSSILHGFMGAVQSAYGYAQDLNESLNNIRIVTGQNIDQMARFADQANKAAKSLSTTTTEYTNASLIYYQQGLSDAEVKERTDITIKMANAAGQSAEIVSDQMTAVWNNFDDGSKSLEYYADVMTALGAATASSTDEIAAGLEKFSAVAETVGLSYEYATAALATVTAETRQSADVVGTAFKTLFARIEGLKLGETLEDGTDLNKYSAALAKVGINIKDASGQLRDMDDILDDLGSRWQTLAKDEQVALAQTVAGVRQYNQLISLMDNWDSFQQNLDTAYGSTGTLEEQANIYAESWEAARDRVQASLETIYQSLINDKYFISFNNGLATVLEGVGTLTKALGGLPGTLGLIGTITTHLFKDQISNGIANTVNNFKVFTKAAKQATDSMREAAIEAIQFFNRGVGESSASGLESQVMIDQIERSYEIQRIAENLTQERAEYLKQMLQIEQQYGNEAVAARKAAEAATTDYTTMRSGARINYVDTALENGEDSDVALGQMEEVFAFTDKFKALGEFSISNEGSRQWLEDIRAIGAEIDDIKIKIEAVDSAPVLDKKAAYQDLTKAVRKFAKEQDYSQNTMEKLAITFKKSHPDIKITTKELLNLMKAAKKQGEEFTKASQATAAYEKRLKELDKELKKGKQAIASLSKGLTTGIQGLTSFATGLSSLSSAWESLQEPDISSFEKFKNVMLSLAIGLPSTIKGIKEMGEGYKAIKEGMGGSLTSILAYALGLDAATLAEKKHNEEKSKGLLLGQAQITQGQNERLNAIANAGAKALNAEAEEEQNEEKAKGIALTLTDIAISKMEQMSEMGGTAAKIAHTAAQWALNGAMSPFIALVLASVAAMLPYIAIAGILALVVYGVVKAVNAENEAMLEAQAAEKRAAENAQRTAEELNNISQSLDKINNGADTLKNLEQGTLEWHKALLEVNNEVQKLITKYPELLEMGAITADANGMLGITQAGQDYIVQQMTQQATQANNIALRAQQNTLEVKTNNAWDDFRSQGGGTLMEESAQALVAAYDVYGDLLFEESEAADQARLAARDLMQQHSGYDFENYYETDTDEELLEFIKNNEALIKQQSENLEQINSIDNQIIQSKLAQYGSQRNLEDTAELVGDNAEAWQGYQVEGTGNSRSLNYTKDGVKRSFNMNKHVNYDKDELPQEIQDFMEMQGDNVEYVAQRHGKLVLKVDGQEIKYSEDEIYDALGELYSGEEFEEQLRTTLTNNLSSALGDSISAGLSGLGTEDLVQLDNISLNIQKSFEKAFPEETAENVTQRANEAFARVVEAYGTTSDQLQQLAKDTEYVDMASGAFQRLIANAELTGPALKTAIQELNTLGELDSMTSWFQETATGLGLSEEDGQKMQDYAKYLAEISTESDELSSNLATNALAAAEVSAQIYSMNKGIEELAEGFEEWNDILQNSSETSVEYFEALDNIKSAMAKILDINKDLISSDFITDPDNLLDIQKAAEGDAEAIDRLQAQMDEEIIANISVGQTDEFIQQVNDSVAALEAVVPEDIEVGMTITGATEAEQAFLDAANKLVADAKMTADEANAYFAGINYEPVYATTEIPDANTVENPASTTEMSIDNIGWSDVPVELPDWFPGDHTITLPKITYSAKPVTKDPVPADANMRLTSFSGGTTPPEIKGLVKKASGSANNYSPSNKGGKTSSGGSKSSSKPKKTKVTKKSEIVERYKEITDVMDDVSDAMERANKQADRLYGAPRLAAMKQNLKLLEQERDVLKEQVKEAKEFYSLDQSALIGAGAEAGLSFEFDNKGNITNYTQQMENLYYQKRMIQNQYNAATDEDTQTRIQEEKLDPLEEKIEAVQEAMEQYEETRELLEDLNMQIQDNLYAEMDAKLEIIEYEVEVNIEINDDDLQYIEYLMSMSEDRAFNAAQTVALLGEQTEILLQQAEAYSKGFSDILANHGLTIEDIANKSAEELANLGFTENEIESLREYTQGMQDVTLALKENQKAIQDQVLETYYEWNEEFERSTAIAEHGSEVLQHYTNIVNILGKGLTGATGKLMEELAEGSVRTATAALEIAQNQYETTKDALERANNELRKAQEEAAKNPESYVAQQNLAFWTETQRELDDQLREQDAKRQAALETVLEAVMEKYRIMSENIIAEFEKSLSKTGKSLQELSEDLDRTIAVDDQYLDDYEKIYELNTMSRDLQKKLDQTGNKNSQKIYMAFLEKVNALKAQGVQLSQYELEALQKEMEVEVAKAQMYEAMTAKTQVIRRKDSEGNWGYVYTAAEDEVGEAVSEYEKSVYEYKKLNQEAANEFTDLIVSTQIEFSEAIAAIQADNTISLEEQEAKIAEATEYYSGQINYYYEQLDSALKNNTSAYENDLAFRSSLDESYVTQYGLGVQQQIDNNKDLQTSFSDTRLSQVTEFTTMEEAQEALYKSAQTMADEIVKSHDWVQTETERILGLVGITLGDSSDAYINFRKLVEQELTGQNGVVNKTEAVAKATEDMKEDAIEDFKGVTDYLSTWNSTYGTAIDTAATTTGRLSEAFGELEKKLRDADAAYKDFTDKAANTTYDYAAAEQKFGTGVADYAQSVYDIEAEGGTPWMVVAGGSTKYKSENSNIAVTADGKVYKTDKPYSTGDIVNTDALTYLTELNPNIRDGKYATYLIHGNGEYAIKEGAVVQFNSRDLKSVIQTDDGKWYAVTDQGVFLWDDIVGSRTVESQVPETPVNKLNILQPDGTHVIRDAAEAYFTGQESLPNRPGNFGGNQVISDGSGNLYVLSAIEEFAKNGNYILVSPNTFDQKKDKNNKPYWTPKPGSEYYEYFDTGGYTGSWGPEGRLAVLHQKEIVLNAQDTENFLLATNVLRDIINKIQLTSLQQGINLMNNINTPNNLTPNIEQNITIHAEFPDATDHSEIELAFDNLVNKANQFAMSK